ncbi:putative nicotinate-nucleotide adenylyltransferase [Candidatus Malacoplasma girerdii]|uniref:Probable nicotinate-nucleotide adenylyltransferase n=1 Tax=Candidatus Malacoplasma girerdii TaxID=1318617 RepID=A0A097SSU9_9BACT|nr:putative nicotinate-nucleotide adenylyltransferase [Candidatus Malacoplasma girerdii]
MLKKKILLYGGSFDPVHKGHTKLLKTAIKTIKPNLTIVMPSKNAVLKSNIHTANSIDRFNMCKIAFKGFHHLKISRFEIDQAKKGPSYTYLTIRYLKKIYKNYKIYLLIGSDRISDFIQWKNYQYILKNVEVVGGIRIKNEIMPTFDGIKLNYQPIEASSQQLRINPDLKLLNKNVVYYFAAKGIYAAEQVKARISSKRFEHTLRVVDMAMEIAKAIGYKNLTQVYLSAIYHDVCKEINVNETMKIVKIHNQKLYPTIHTMHGLAASIYIKRHFFVNDKKVLSAIKGHVLGNKNWSIKKNNTLEMILYCADKLEPHRTKEDISDRIGLLKLAKKDLDLAYKTIYEETTSKYAKL